MSMCASKIHVKLGRCQKVHLPAHFHIATESQFVLRLVFHLACVVLRFSLPLTTAIAP